MTNIVFSFTKTQMKESVKKAFSTIVSFKDDLPPSNFIVAMAMRLLPVTPEEFDAAWQSMSEYVKENYAEFIDDSFDSID